MFFFGNHVSEAQIIGMSDLQRTVSTAFNFRFAVQNSVSSTRSQARDPWNEQNVSTCHQAWERCSHITRCECKMNRTGILR